MKTVAEINRAIMAGSWNGDEIRSLIQAINYVSRERQSRAAHSFARGDKVEFTTKSGVVVKGTVMKVNQKTVSVQAFEGNQWKVSGSLLRKRA